MICCEANFRELISVLIFLTIVICFGDLVINPPERKELPFTLGRMEALYERYKEARMI